MSMKNMFVIHIYMDLEFFCKHRMFVLFSWKERKGN